MLVSSLEDVNYGKFSKMVGPSQSWEGLALALLENPQSLLEEELGVPGLISTQITLSPFR